VFVAQHATATCCRTCLARWHDLPAGRALDDAERGYVVEAICRWIAPPVGGAAGHRRLDLLYSPAQSENINFFGSIEVDIDAELAQLGPTGYRPLRVRDTLF
jgi:uncharacterized protein DUF4186